MSGRRSVEVQCPDCGGHLTVDLESGRVVRHGKARTPDGEPGGDAALQRAIERVRARESGGADAFDQAVRDVKEQKAKLEDAFEKARRRETKKD